jgi:hypothetical protein
MMKVRKEPAVIIGGVSGRPLSEKGFDQKRLREVYGYSEGEARKAEEFLHEIRVADEAGGESLAVIAALTESALRREGKRTAEGLREALYKTFDGLPAVSYNLAGEAGRRAYMQSGRYKAAGIRAEALEGRAGSAAGTESLPGGAGGMVSGAERSIRPVWRSRAGIAPERRSAPRGMPEEIRPAYKDGQGNVVAYELTEGRKSVYSRPVSGRGKGGGASGVKAEAGAAGDVVPLEFSSSGMAAGSSGAGSAAGVRVNPSRPRAGGEAYSFTPASESSGGPAFPHGPGAGKAPGSAEGVSFMNEGQPERSSGSLKPAGGRKTVSEDPELARLRRIEANYERDKAMLEREKQPALARSATHEVGHAEGVEEEVPSRMEIKKMSAQLENKLKSKVKRNFT